MSEEVDLILGMMLSNCHPKTLLCNQTVGGENGSCGKTVVLGDCWRGSRAECPHTRRVCCCLFSVAARRRPNFAFQPRTRFSSCLANFAAVAAHVTGTNR